MSLSLKKSSLRYAKYKCNVEYGESHIMEYLAKRIGEDTAMQVIVLALNEMIELGTNVSYFPNIGITIFSKVS